VYMKRMHLFSNNNVVVPRLVHRLDVFGFVLIDLVFFFSHYLFLMYL
jgi:hypothetical protein